MKRRLRHVVLTERIETTCDDLMREIDRTMAKTVRAQTRLNRARTQLLVIRKCASGVRLNIGGAR